MRQRHIQVSIRHRAEVATMAIRMFLIALSVSFPMALAVAGQPCQPGRADPIDAWEASAVAEDPSTAGIRNAANAARRMWDEEMNASYRRLLSKLSRAQQQALRVSQRHWLAFRDAEGEVISTVVAAREGTLHQLMATGEWKELVKARTLQLRAHEVAVGGPVACVQ
jgi:uncharacterized protein YecT (DUF1311 family)